MLRVSLKRVLVLLVAMTWMGVYGGATAQSNVDDSSLSSLEEGDLSSADAEADVVQGEGVDVADESAETAARRPAIYSNVDEIVVSSQRRAVQSNEMPIAISVLDSETVDFHNLTDTNVAQLYTPNVTVYNEPTWSFISIRGMGSDLNPGFEQSVGIVFDYINMGKADFLINSLLDVGQIEVLRGPQGIIVAKNATAGAYVITSARPEHDWGAKYDISTFHFENDIRETPIEFSGAVTGPVIEEVLAFRAALFFADVEGQTYNSKLDRFQANDNELAARFSLLWDPNENLDVMAGVTYSTVSENGVNHELAYASDDYRAVSEPFGEVETDQFNDRSAQDFPGFVDRSTLIATLNGEYEIDEHSKIGLATGYARTSGEGSLDADWGPAPLFATVADGWYDQFSVEMNYTFERNTEAEKDDQRDGASMKDAGGFLVGALYFTNAQDGSNDLVLFPTGSGAPLNGDILCSVSVVCDASLFPSVVDASHTHRRKFKQTTDSYAVFAAGNIAVPWTDRWLVGAGVRYVLETKKVDYQSELDPEGAVNLWPYLIPDTTDFGAKKERTEDAITWRVTLQWFPTSHDANYFVNASRGWKAGGYNAAAGIEEELEFGPETSWSVEAGAKVQFFDDVLTSNVTVFYSEFSDLQTSTYNGEKFIVGNAASAFSQGVELEFWLKPWEDLGLIYALQASLLEVRFLDYQNGPCPAGQTGSCDRSGALRGGHLPWQASMSVTHEELFEEWGIGLVGQVAWAVRPNDSGRDDGDPKHEVLALSWVNFRVGIKDIEDKWHLSLVCGICIGDGSSGGFDVPVFAGTHAHIPRKGPSFQLRLYGYF